MANVQLLTDNLLDRNDGTFTPKYEADLLIEDFNCISMEYFSRVFNRVDSRVGRAGEDRPASRESGMTYQLALRELAKDICLETKKSETEKQAIRQTRGFLTQDFLDKMEFHGVRINNTTWKWSETMEAQDVARAVGNSVGESCAW